MSHRVYFTADGGDALKFAMEHLKLRGAKITDLPSPIVTDVLLGVPCRTSSEDLNSILAALSPEVRIYGGFLDREELKGYQRYDLLKSEGYLAKNAAITAHCALQLAAQRLPVILPGCQVLVLGWGRIGKCLAKLLKDTGCDVTVGVRKEEQRAILEALGYNGAVLPLQEYTLPQFRAIFNTIPSPILSADTLDLCRDGCVKLELASEDGLAGKDVLIARGLPGKMAPESSGHLIAQTVMALNAMKEDRI